MNIKTCKRVLEEYQQQYSLLESKMYLFMNGYLEELIKDKYNLTIDSVVIFIVGKWSNKKIGVVDYVDFLLDKFVLCDILEFNYFIESEVMNCEYVGYMKDGVFYETK